MRRLRRQIRRAKSKVGALFHVNHQLAFQAKIRDCAQRFVGLGIDLGQTAIELAELSFNTSDTSPEAADVLFGLIQPTLGLSDASGDRILRAP